MFKTRKNSILIILISGIIWTVTALFILNGSNFLPGVDTYYHIKLANIMAEYDLILPSKCPWTSCSIWKNAFFDKEWLFHVGLIPFLTLGNMLGGKIFILTSVFLCVIVWGFLLKVLKSKFIFFPLLVTFTITGSAFISRLILCRPHLLSIILFALILIFLVKNKRLYLFITSFIYSLAYTGYYQVIPIVILFDLIMFKQIKRQSWKNFSSIYVFCGIIIGTILNPYFPANIIGLYIQNIMILKTSLIGGTLYKLNLGAELYSPSLLTLLLNYLPLFFINIIAFISLLEKRNSIDNFRIKLFFGCLSIVYMVLTIFVVKFTDYSIPLIVTFIILYYHDNLVKYQKRKLLLTTLSILLIIYGSYSFNCLKKEILRKNIPYTDIAAWIVKNVKNKNDERHPQRLIFTSTWDDTPYLFYHLPQFKYLVFLDPYFMYYYSPDQYRMWQKISEGKTTHPALLIQQYFKTNLIFVNSRNKMLQKQLEESPHIIKKYKGKDGAMFFIAGKFN